MKLRFQELDLHGKRLEAAERADEILNEYAEGGWILTLRQLYYQFVARGLLENTERNYKWLGSVVNDARLAGALDWAYLTDRTRTCCTQSFWDSPKDILEAVVSGYQIDWWRNQPYRVEVWVEKDALVDVVGRAADNMAVSYFSCRGYCSQSAMFEAAQRFAGYLKAGQKPALLYFGDHDPSGIDMGRDIQARMDMFLEGNEFLFHRLALTMEQIEEYNPPPNPAKLTDSRCQGYMAKHGDESWELDALEPDVIVGLIENRIAELRDDKNWKLMAKRFAREKKLLKALIDQVKD